MKIKELKEVMKDNLFFEDCPIKPSISIVEFGDTIFDEPIELVMIEMSNKKNVIKVKLSSKEDKHAKENTSKLFTTLLSGTENDNKELQVFKVNENNQLIESELSLHNVELSERFFTLELKEKN